MVCAIRFAPASILSTGDMLIGDVGETAREEVDVQLASNPGGGENYGWRYREGFIQNPIIRGRALRRPTRSIRFLTTSSWHDRHLA